MFNVIDRPQLELVDVVVATTAGANLRQAVEVGGCVAGASRMVNAIPAVCPAPPGLLSALDLALVI